jgi:hypothetical protein
MFELIQHDGDKWVSAGVPNKEFDVPPVLAEHKGKWVPVIPDDKPTYNQRKTTLTRVKTVNENDVRITFKKTTKKPVAVADEHKEIILAELKNRADRDPPGYAGKVTAIDGIMNGSGTDAQKVTAILAVSS